MHKAKYDIIHSLCFILFGLFFLFQAAKIPILQLFIDLSPRIWPEIVLILLLLCSIILLVSSFVAYSRQNKIATPPPASYSLKTSMGMIVCLLSALALLPLGFFITAPLFLPIFMYILGVRSVKKLIIIPPIATAILGYIFTRIVYVPFPKGVWIFYDINVFFY